MLAQKRAAEEDTRAQKSMRVTDPPAPRGEDFTDDLLVFELDAEDDAAAYEATAAVDTAPSTRAADPTAVGIDSDLGVDSIAIATIYTDAWVSALRPHGCGSRLLE